MRVPSTEIQAANHAIETALANLEFFDRGFVAQSVLCNIRNLTEHILVYATFGNTVAQTQYYDAICDAVKRARSDRQLRFIWDFHQLLQKVVSHYTPSESSSERLLLRYLESLYLLRKFADERLFMHILCNLDMFPVSQDATLQDYYKQIAEKTDQLDSGLSFPFLKNRYYIGSTKPFFVDGRVYYELSFLPAFDNSSKFDRAIAFSRERIPDNYAVLLSIMNTGIEFCGHRIPVAVISDWKTSIRPCEINGLLKVIGEEQYINGGLRSYKSLMRLLDDSKLKLNEICELPDSEYSYATSFIEQSGDNTGIESLLNRSRIILKSNLTGSNVLRYLLYAPRNRVIKDQLQERANNWLGYLHLSNGCLPFERNPFSSNLLGHIVSMSDVMRCIETEGREPDILARQIINLSENTRQVFISDSELSHIDNLDSLIEEYNSGLYSDHSERHLVHENGQVFLRGNETNITKVIENLLELSKSGISGYTATASAWIASKSIELDDTHKQAIMRSLYESTKVSLVYGSAGTGKTTMVNYVCSLLGSIRKCAIANTNPAVDGLRRRIEDENCICKTITKFLAGHETFDFLIVDECSTVSNRDMAKILESGRFETLLLVGDVRQIEAINLGNWFDLARTFLPSYCTHELLFPWRTTANSLLTLWDSVRHVKNDITEIMEANGMSSNIDETIFDARSSDEIVLCLNYDGVYGINNVNRILQSHNYNPAFTWGVHHYKAGDPILFNESNRFSPLLYNNLKGEIVAIEKPSIDRIVFDVAVETPIHELATSRYEGLSYVGNDRGNSIVRFSVIAINDQDDEGDSSNVVPFQVAYAVSIHKAQGLEYESVKVVVTKDVEKAISHNVFYTAITRAKSNLLIYWTPETQKCVINSFSISSTNKDASLLSNRHQFAMHP